MVVSFTCHLNRRASGRLAQYKGWLAAVNLNHPVVRPALAAMRRVQDRSALGLHLPSVPWCFAHERETKGVKPKASRKYLILNCLWEAV
jgi:hypothetical protein